MKICKIKIIDQKLYWDFYQSSALRPPMFWLGRCNNMCWTLFIVECTSAVTLSAQYTPGVHCSFYQSVKKNTYRQTRLCLVLYTLDVWKLSGHEVLNSRFLLTMISGIKLQIKVCTDGIINIYENYLLFINFT